MSDNYTSNRNIQYRSTRMLPIYVGLLCIYIAGSAWTMKYVSVISGIALGTLITTFIILFGCSSMVASVLSGKGIKNEIHAAVLPLVIGLINAFTQKPPLITDTIKHACIEVFMLELGCFILGTLLFYIPYTVPLYKQTRSKR